MERDIFNKTENQHQISCKIRKEWVRNEMLQTLYAESIMKMFKDV